MTVDELFQSAVDKPQFQRVNDAKRNLEIVARYFSQAMGPEYAAIASIAAISTFVAADGEVTPEEFEFVQSILEEEVDYDTFFSAAKAAFNSSIHATIDRIIDNAPDNIKLAFLALCLDFIACDRTITPEEIALFAKYVQ